jgi:hypothetical protein
VREIVRLQGLPSLGHLQLLLVPATDQLLVSSNTRCLLPRRNMGQPPATTPTGDLAGSHLMVHLRPDDSRRPIQLCLLATSTMRCDKDLLTRRILTLRSTVGAAGKNFGPGRRHGRGSWRMHGHCRTNLPAMLVRIKSLLGKFGACLAYRHASWRAISKGWPDRYGDGKNGANACCHCHKRAVTEKESPATWGRG